MYTIKQAKNVSGDINLSGSKNAVLPIMVAACLCEESVVLKNVPLELRDVQILYDILIESGFNIEIIKPDMLRYNPVSEEKIITDVSPLAGKIRYSLLLLSLMLQKVKQASIPLPGGCSLGDRKYDIHIDALSKMGAQVSEDDGKILGKLNGKFIGRTLTFHTATTSGTENVIIAGVLATGTTIIENAHTCPEVIDLINFLNSMGANINYSARYIEIQGVNSLRGVEYRIMNDKDEALTYMILAAALRSSLRIKDFDIDIIPSEASLLREIGADVFQVGRDCFVNSTYKGLKPFHLATSPYPGIVDAQPLFAALALTIQGESIITEMRHSSRFQYVEEFKKFGGNIKQYHNCIVIIGGKQLSGATVKAPDLRAGAALIIVGALAQNETTIDDEYQIERGYSEMVKKLEGIGISCVLS